MTTTATPSAGTGTSWWGAILLGIVFILAGLYMLGNVVWATLVSAFVIGILLLIAGGAEVFQAFSASQWRGFLLRLLIGALYFIGGAILIYDPLAASLIMTLIFGVALIATGVVRLFQAIMYWNWSGWLLFASGIIGILAGLIILAKWPITGLWVLGFVVGVDLIVHGIWWISLGWELRNARQPV